MIPMCGELRLSPVRASKNVFVGVAKVSSSGAAPWAKVVIEQPKQSNVAYTAARKNSFEMTTLRRRFDTRHDTSFVAFRGRGGAKERMDHGNRSPASLA